MNGKVNEWNRRNKWHDMNDRYMGWKHEWLDEWMEIFVWMIVLEWTNLMKW